MKFFNAVITSLFISVVVLPGCGVIKGVPQKQEQQNTQTAQAPRHKVIYKNTRASNEMLHGQLSSNLKQALSKGQLASHLQASDRALNEDLAKKVLSNKYNNQVDGWSNPNTGHAGNFIAYDTKTVGDKVCRTYVNVIIINETTERLSGQACKKRNETDHWEVVSSL